MTKSSRASKRKNRRSFFFQAEDGIRDDLVTGVQTCALRIFLRRADGTMCVAAVDRGHDTVKYQTRTLARRYGRVLEHLPSEFGLILAVATERRCQLYRKWAARPIARPFTHDTLQPY